MSKFVLRRREPYTFMLYLGLLGSALLFFFILFVFFQKAWGNQQLTIPLPWQFWVSTFLLLGSSLSLQAAQMAFKTDNFSRYRLWMGVTFGLAVLFLVCQLNGWQSVLSSGKTMANDTGASFLYILSGLHIVHTLGGVVWLGLAVRTAFTHLSYLDSFVYSVNPPNQLRLKLISIYWHFVDILWLILFFFLLAYAP